MSGAFSANFGDFPLESLIEINLSKNNFAILKLLLYLYLEEVNQIKIKKYIKILIETVSYEGNFEGILSILIETENYLKIDKIELDSLKNFSISSETKIIEEKKIKPAKPLSETKKKYKPKKMKNCK